MIRSLLVLAAIVVLSGCAAAKDASGVMQRNYAIVAEVNQNYSDIRGSQQARVCQNLLQLKKFDVFDACMADLRKNRMPGGRFPIGGGGIGGGSDDFSNKAFGDAYYYGILAEGALERADFETAVKYGEIALKGVNNAPSQRESYGGKYGELSLVIIAPRVYGVMALSQGALGNEQAAKRYTDLLENLNFDCFVCSGFKRDQITWLSRAKFASGDTEGAYQVLTGKNLTMDSLGFSALKAVNRINPAYYGVKLFTGFDLGDIETELNLQTNTMQCRALFLARSEASYSCYHSILENEFTPFYGSIEFLALKDSATIEIEAGEFAKAEEKLKRAINLLELQRSSLKLETHKMGFLTDKLAVYQKLIPILVSQGRHGEAFAYAERAKARALIDTLATRDNLVRSKSSPATASLSDSIVKQEARLSVTDVNFNSQQRSLDRSLLIQAKQALNTAAPDFASLTTVSPPDVKLLQTRLGQGEALIEYYGAGDQWFLFLLTAEGITSIEIEAGQIESLARQFRSQIQSRGIYKPTAMALYDRLVKPVSHLIATNSRLTIVPHGILHYLPFAALHDGNGFLVDRFSINILPSASVLTFLDNEPNTSHGNLVLGNPDLKNTELDLPGAEIEATEIAGILPDTTLLTRAEATESAVKNRRGNYRYLHVASHGIYNDEKPLESGLLLASDTQNDGILTVAELYSTTIDADLVTLSACETGLGKVSSGDDVVGFSRGFLYAGADSIVSSLWKVDDAATNQLMQNFYRRLQQSDKGAALRLAQLDYKNLYSDHPYYWAAFQLTGSRF